MKITKRSKIFGCPTELTLDVLGGKWKTVILCYLNERPCRYRDLRKLMPDLSDKILSERLADLRARGLVEQRRSGGASVYALTSMGETLKPALAALYTWGKKNARELGARVDDPFRRLDEEAGR